MGLWDIEDDCGAVQGSFRAPDGNVVVDFDESYYENFDWFVENVL
jgi:hypothetical protein